jgi:hypothetical protein
MIARLSIVFNNSHLLYLLSSEFRELRQPAGIDGFIVVPSQNQPSDNLSLFSYLSDFEDYSISPASKTISQQG